MDASFRCCIILSAIILFAVVAWRRTQPATGHETARFSWQYVDPVTVTFVDSASGMTIVVSGEVAYALPAAGGQVTFEDRLNGELMDAGPPFEEGGIGRLRFRDTFQRPESYPLTLSRTAFTRVDGRLVCVSRFAVTADGPGVVTARLATSYPVQRLIQPTESATECATPHAR